MRRQARRITGQPSFAIGHLHLLIGGLEYAGLGDDEQAGERVTYAALQ